jgi:hypothetical protein
MTSFMRLTQRGKPPPGLHRQPDGLHPEHDLQPWPAALHRDGHPGRRRPGGWQLGAEAEIGARRRRASPSQKGLLLLARDAAKREALPRKNVGNAQPAFLTERASVKKVLEHLGLAASTTLASS